MDWPWSTDPVFSLVFVTPLENREGLYRIKDGCVSLLRQLLSLAGVDSPNRVLEEIYESYCCLTQDVPGDPNSRPLKKISPIAYLIYRCQEGTLWKILGGYAYCLLLSYLPKMALQRRTLRSVVSTTITAVIHGLGTKHPETEVQDIVSSPDPSNLTADDFVRCVNDRITYVCATTGSFTPETAEDYREAIKRLASGQVPRSRHIWVVARRRSPRHAWQWRKNNPFSTLIWEDRADEPDPFELRVLEKPQVVKLAIDEGEDPSELYEYAPLPDPSYRSTPPWVDAAIRRSNCRQSSLPFWLYDRDAACRILDLSRRLPDGKAAAALVFLFLLSLTIGVDPRDLLYSAGSENAAEERRRTRIWWSANRIVLCNPVDFLASPENPSLFRPTVDSFDIPLSPFVRAVSKILEREGLPPEVIRSGLESLSVAEVQEVLDRAKDEFMSPFSLRNIQRLCFCRLVSVLELDPIEAVYLSGYLPRRFRAQAAYTSIPTRKLRESALFVAASTLFLLGVSEMYHFRRRSCRAATGEIDRAQRELWRKKLNDLHSEERIGSRLVADLGKLADIFARLREAEAGRTDIDAYNLATARRFLQVAILTGLRPSELRRLKQEDIDIDCGILRVMGKANRLYDEDRVVPLCSAAARVLHEQMQHRRRIFLQYGVPLYSSGVFCQLRPKTKRPVSQGDVLLRTLRQVFRDFPREINFPRHTLNTWLYDHSVKEEIRSLVLGHTTAGFEPSGAFSLRNVAESRRIFLQFASELADRLNIGK